MPQGVPFSPMTQAPVASTSQRRGPENHSELRREPFRVHQVVAIHASQVDAAGQGGDLIQAGAQAEGAAVADQADAFVFYGSCDGGAPIRGTIVDQDEFPIGVGLGEHGADRLRQRGRAVQKRNADADHDSG